MFKLADEDDRFHARLIGWWAIASIAMMLIAALSTLFTYAAYLFAVIGIVVSWPAFTLWGAVRAWNLRAMPRRALVAALGFPVVLIATCALWIPIVNWAYFLVTIPARQHIVDLAKQGVRQPRNQWLGRKWGVDFVVADSAPLRVAFPKPGQFLDNWSGIVYDPTGAVEQGDFDTYPTQIKKLFDGDMVVCDHIVGPWYDCAFT